MPKELALVAYNDLESQVEALERDGSDDYTEIPALSE